jgi:hypothetical protein
MVKPAPMPRLAAATRPKMFMPKITSEGGGRGGYTGTPTPIVVAGGEYTVPIGMVRAIGSGDVNRGHKIFDAYVLLERRDHIRTLRKLPPPAKK